MKIIAYPCILISLLACCNLFEPKKSTSTCPDIDALWLRADSFYTAHGKLAVDTLNDSFAPLSVGNTWEYEYTVVQATAGSAADTNQILTTTCGNISIQVVQSTGSTAILKWECGSSVLYDTLRITDDSIINMDRVDSIPIMFSNPFFPAIPAFAPVLIGPRKSTFPCFKFDDGSGYSYLDFFAGLYFAGEYFSRYGLTYLSFNDYNFELQTFNGAPVNVQQHVYEGYRKDMYYIDNPDSIAGPAF